MRRFSKTIALLCLMIACSFTQSAASSMRGIEEIGLRVNIRIEDAEAVDRLDEDYLRNLINWQLDQYQIKVSPRNPGVPFLSVQIRVERVLGPARLSDEGDRSIEGVFQSTVAVQFQQQVVSKDNPGYEFWAPTYSRSNINSEESRKDLQHALVRSLERNLIGFINQFRRANPR